MEVRGRPSGCGAAPPGSAAVWGGRGGTCAGAGAGLPAALARVPGSRPGGGKRQTMKAGLRAAVPGPRSLPEAGRGQLRGSHVLPREQKPRQGDVAPAPLMSLPWQCVLTRVHVKKGSGDAASGLLSSQRVPEAAGPSGHGFSFPLPSSCCGSLRLSRSLGLLLPSGETPSYQGSRGEGAAPPPARPAAPGGCGGSSGARHRRARGSSSSARPGAPQGRV